MSKDRHPEHDDKSLPDPAQGPAHDVPTFVELVKGERICMFSTVDADGDIHARPMAVQQVDDDGTVWFMAYADSPKLQQLRAGTGVNLAFVGSSSWVSASGTGEVLDDVAKKKELWNPFAESWFQREPEDPEIVVIKVQVTGGEYWDSPSKPAQLFGMLKSLFTKERPDDGENAKLDLQ